MKTPTNHGNIIEIENASKRPEAPQGPERDLVSPTRSEDKPEHAEDLREGKRVSPGEAKAARIRAMIIEMQGEALGLLVRSVEAKKAGYHGSARYCDGLAHARYEIALRLTKLLPEPDSGAAEIPAARPNQDASTEATTDAPTCDERSGRRNAATHTPGANGKPLK